MAHCCLVRPYQLIVSACFRVATFIIPIMSAMSDSSNSSPIKYRHEEQFVTLFEPLIINLENHVEKVTQSQDNLRRELEALLINLRSVQTNNELTELLEEKAKKLVSLKRRLTLVHTILENVNERCRKMMITHKIAPERQ